MPGDKSPGTLHEKIMRVWMGPIPTALIYLLVGMFFGTLISLVMAAFLKRPAPSQAAPA